MRHSLPDSISHNILFEHIRWHWLSKYLLSVASLVSNSEPLACYKPSSLVPSVSVFNRWPSLRRLIAPTSCPAPCQSAPKTRWPSSLPTSKIGTSWCRGSLTSCNRPLPKSTLREKSQAASAAQTTRWAECCMFVILVFMSIFFILLLKINIDFCAYLYCTWYGRLCCLICWYKTEWYFTTPYYTVLYCTI